MITADTELGHLLDELLSESPHRTIERARTAYDQFAGGLPTEVVIAGAGQLGRFVFPGVRAAGLNPLAYCDNNSSLWGTQIEGVPVMSPAAAVERYGDRACFLTAIYNPSAITRQLRELGCTRIVPYPAFFWKFSAVLSDERLDLPNRILQQIDGMRPAYDLLADDTSRREFCAQLRWRCFLDYDCLPRPEPSKEMYFPRELFRLSPDEVLVDCGAFDGDSLGAFVEKVDGRFQHIYAVEPDPGNIRALRTYLDTLPEDVAARITILQYALGRGGGTVRFEAAGSVGSKIVESGGTVEVQCQSLDGGLGANVRPTLIKMDIEGAELDAIAGAAQTIADCRPIMAVCAYHHCSDLWILPGLLKAAYPEYQIFLRRYAEECWETVYYAVPPDRLERS
ncbi:MAG TPA: FkbM family methyltransferase [Bryobacteraceae bacterium]|jgi:FkbM family methyltransferase|nr:FkbM family methyltransferase [Bryobacteraceae bacterium]